MSIFANDSFTTKFYTSDKIYHFVGSFGLFFFFLGVFDSVIKFSNPLSISFFCTIFGGIIVEILDIKYGDGFSVRDLICDISGTGAALIWSLLIL